MFTAFSKMKFDAQTIGAISAGTSVLLGAFGAHGLKNGLSDLDKDQQAYYLDVWKTAAQYHMIHSIGMILAPMVQKHAPNYIPAAFPRSAQMFMAGIGLFSGSLYTLVLSRQKWLGAVAPIGGVLMASGWLAMAMRE